MIRKVPDEILLQGPAAFAAWLEREEEARLMGMSHQAAATLVKLGKAAGIYDGSMRTNDDYTSVLSATVMLACAMTFAASGGMRAPARDGLSELIDECFNTLDDPKTVMLRELVDELKRKRRK